MFGLLSLAVTTIWSSALYPAALAAAEKMAQAAADEAVLATAKVEIDGPSLLAYFRKRTLSADDQTVIERQIEDLGSLSYRVRRRASAALVARGSIAAMAVRAARDSADLEVARRAGNVLRRIGDLDAGPGVTAAAARVLAHIKPVGSVPTLLDFLPFAEDETVADAAVKALAAIVSRNPQASEVLVKALTDKDAVKRAGAAVALLLGGPAELRPRIRALLGDPAPVTRLHVAIALAHARDKQAVPVLIDLLDRLPPARAYRAHDFLFQIAGDDAPDIPLGIGAEERARCKAVWSNWWSKTGARVNFARLSEKPRLMGYTMMVLLDAGKVIERDAAGKLRWEVDGFQLPLDAQLLVGNRLLVAEHGGNRITERNLKGEVLWEKRVPQPLTAQRLPNGHTFVCTRSEMLEVDRAGKEVRTWPSPDGNNFSRATRLPNGDIVCVTIGDLASQLYRLSPSGTQKKAFGVNISTSGGRVEVLPNGNVLMAEMVHNRVLEYDEDGRVVWIARVRQPVAAVRLANGNTLVTTYSQNRALELDKNGDEVADFREESRVTRAWRR